MAEIRSRPGFVHLEDLPQIYQQGVVAVEDHRFYTHPGVDVLAIARAVKNDIVARSFVEGGSTITQQLVKNLYFNHDKSVLRKVAEMFLSVRLEREFSKKDILELYVNCIYFGRECYGIGDASRVYFQKFPWELNDYEATLLVGIPNGPKYFDPNLNPKGAQNRHRRVIRDLIKRKVITEEKGKEILGDQWIGMMFQRSRNDIMERKKGFVSLTGISPFYNEIGNICSSKTVVNVDHTGSGST